MTSHTDQGVFHEGERAVQQRAGVASIAARLGPLMVQPELDPDFAEFLEEQPFLVVASTEGGPHSDADIGHEHGDDRRYEKDQPTGSGTNGRQQAKQCKHWGVAPCSFSGGAPPVSTSADSSLWTPEVGA